MGNPGCKILSLVGLALMFRWFEGAKAQAEMSKFDFPGILLRSEATMNQIWVLRGEIPFPGTLFLPTHTGIIVGLEMLLWIRNGYKSSRDLSSSFFTCSTSFPPPRSFFSLSLGYFFRFQLPGHMQDPWAGTAQLELQRQMKSMELPWGEKRQL